MWILEKKYKLFCDEIYIFDGLKNEWYLSNVTFPKKMSHITAVHDTKRDNVHIFGGNSEKHYVIKIGIRNDFWKKLNQFCMKHNIMVSVAEIIFIFCDDSIFGGIASLFPWKA